MKIDGKELSEETIKKACEAYGISFKKEFEPISIHLGCFKVDVNGQFVKVSTGSVYGVASCMHGTNEARRFINALQSAIDYIENK